MSNWIDYVKQYSIEHGIPYNEALMKAGPGYRKLYGGVVSGGKKKSMSRKKKSNKKKMMDSQPMMMSRIKKRKNMEKKGGKMKDQKAYRVGQDLYDVLGGAKGAKGALAALLSGLDARVNIK